MKQFKLLLAAGAMMIASGMQAQTNLISEWDGGSSTASPSTFGWTSSANRTLQPLNNNGGIRFTTTYSGYKLEDGSAYSYNASSDPSSKIFWLRYNTSGESFTYTFTGLEAGKDYKFSGLVGWHNNSSNPTFTVKVIGSSGVELGTWSKNITAKQTLSQAEINFEVPFEESSTSYMLQFTSSTAGDCMEALSAFKLVEVENEAKLDNYKAKHAKAVATANYLLDLADYASVTGEARTNLQAKISATASEETASAYYYLTKDIYAAIAPFQNAAENVNLVGGYLTNADFSQGELATVGICTYDYDEETNNTTYSQLVPVEGWNIPSNGNARAGGLVAFGSGVWIGGVGYNCPNTNADGETTGNILGLVSVWRSTTQYTQDVTLPAGTYTLILGVYNSKGGTTAVAKNLIGFIEDNGTEHLATTTQYTVNNWKFEFISFTLSETTSGKISLGYTAANAGSKDMPHLFLSGIELWNGEVNAEEYEAAKALKLAKADYQIELEKARALLANADYEIVVGGERSDLEALCGDDVVIPETLEGVQTAKTALSNAISAFTSAKENYENYYTFKNNIEDPQLEYASVDIKNAFTDALDAEPTSGADALAKIEGIKSALRAYYESHALAEGFDGAVDMTDLITNATDPTNNDGWTWTGSKNDPASNEPWTDADGNNTHSYFDGGDWNSSSWTTTMKQYITLPAGRYLLTAKGRAANNVTFTMAIGLSQVGLPHVGSTGNVFDRGWGDASVEYETQYGGNTEILITASSSTSHEWFSISDFRLVQLEAYTVEMATEQDYGYLNEMIAEVEAVDWGFQEGQYAPYNHKELLAQLGQAKAMAAAHEAYPEAENPYDIVNGLTVALSEMMYDAENPLVANTEEVNAVYNGMFATVQEDANYPEGWIRTNVWGQMQSGIEGDYATAYYNQPGSLMYGDSGLPYIMPLSGNTCYKLTFRYRSHENGSNQGMTVSVLNSNNEGLADKSFPANSSTTEWAEGSVLFQTGAAGNYVLTLGNSGNTWITFVELYTTEIIVDENMPWEGLEGEDVPVALNRTIKEGMNTVVLPFDLTADDITTLGGEGAVAYTVSAYNAATDNLTFGVLSEVPANQPFFLKATQAGKEYSFEGKTLVSGDPILEVSEDCSLVGNYTAKKTVPQSDANGSYYILSGGKFYSVDSDVTIKNTRFYVATSAPAGANALSFSFEDEVTGINGIADETAAPKAIYNLQGQKVNAPVKGGIYIIDGKKVLVK